MKKFQLPLPRLDSSFAHTLALDAMHIGCKTNYIDEWSVRAALIISDKLEGMLPIETVLPEQGTYFKTQEWPYKKRRFLP